MHVSNISATHWAPTVPADSSFQESNETLNLSIEDVSKIICILSEILRTTTQREPVQSFFKFAFLEQY
jgi:hypothetical protein